MVFYPPPTSSSQKKYFPRLPTLEECPPPVEQPQGSIGTPTSTASFEPLSEAEISFLSLPPTVDTADYITTSTTHSGVPLSDVVEPEKSTDITIAFDPATPRVDQVSAERSSRETRNGSTSTLNNVSFIPAPTLAPSSLGVDHPSADDLSATSTVVRSPTMHPRVPHGPTSTAASASRIGVGSSENGIPAVKAATTPRGPSPYPTKLGYGDGASIYQSLGSGTSFSTESTGSVLPPGSWSEAVGEDLVTHLGPREQTRQEILWEIVASEERYVAELLKMRESFIAPLLHPYASTPRVSPTMLEYDEMSRLETPVESLEHLPIASRFLSPIGFQSKIPTALEHASRSDRLGTGFQESRRGGHDNSNVASKHNHPRSPYGASRTGKNSSRKSPTKADLIASGNVAPYQIPEDLRQCLEVIEDSIGGHTKFSECLRDRYDEQFPLVRSLEDVFMANSHILRGYTDYVLHLDRALEQANDAIMASNSTKRPKSKNRDADEWLRVSVFMRKLELNAQNRGDTGLAVSLSKPLHRLLEYPLLFQNLFSHTDPSTFEYDSTLLVVVEVENIVRSIEDENSQKEEWDKTRDIFARIEGLEKIKQLAAPKPSRILLEERLLTPRESSDALKPSPPAGTTRAVRGKTSFKRLSDVLQGGGGAVGGKKDIWLVEFNDVVLRCQRTGTTSLPLGRANASRTNSLLDFQGKSTYATTGRRNLSVRPRNLYKFIRIESWAIGNVVQPREGVVSMEDVIRSRKLVHSAVRPQFMPIPEEDEDRSVHSDDSDRMSEMSFSYWGGDSDSISLQKSPVESQLGPEEYGLRRRHIEGSMLSLYPGSSLANARFGSRLVSVNSIFSGSRPPSHLTVTTPSPSVMSDEGYLVKVEEHVWGQFDPFLYSGESFVDAKLTAYSRTGLEKTSVVCDLILALNRPQS